MSDMSNLYRAYSAVHNVEIKEELQQNRDLISEMNLTQVLQSDLVEVCEEIVEGLFEYGLDLDETCVVISALLEEVTEGTSNELREGKIDQIAEAFGTVVDTVTDKAERNCEEEFLLYRQNKPLTEKWNNKVSHEVGNAKLHASLIHEDRHQIKFGLIEMISDIMEASGIEYPTGKKQSFTKRKDDPKVAAGRKAAKEMGLKHNEETEVSTLRQGWGDAYTSIYEKKKLDPVGQEDDDVDNDGDSDSTDKYLKKRRKAIGKAMGKDEDDDNGDGGMSEGIDPKGAARMDAAKPKKKVDVFAYDRKLQAQGKLKGKKLPPPPTNEEVENVEERWVGKHGQFDTEYARSRSNAGKMISGDDKMSGAEYTHGRRVKVANPGMQPDVGGKTKPKSQGKMDKGSRADLQFRKAALKKASMKKEEVSFSEAELARIEEIVNSWED